MIATGGVVYGSWERGEVCSLRVGDRVAVHRVTTSDDGSEVVSRAEGVLRKWTDGWFGFSACPLVVSSTGVVPSTLARVELLERVEIKVGDVVRIKDVHDRLPNLAVIGEVVKVGSVYRSAPGDVYDARGLPNERRVEYLPPTPEDVPF